jgi:putative ABC transport system permease protein
MDSIKQDLRYALRSLRRGGLLIGIAVLSLGIGVGSVTTIFSAVDVFMLRPLPYPPDFVDFRERAQTMEVATSTGAAFNLSEGDRPERIQGRRLSWNFLQVLGVRPALGRAFTPDEEVPGEHRVAIISHGLWQRRFGGDPEVLGAVFLLDGEPYTIVGVMPTDFWYGSIFDDVWVPLAISGEESRGSHYLSVFARVGPTGNGARIVTLHEDIFNEGFKVGTSISMLAVLFLLLIACANVANLLLTHAAGREREMAVRSALGAGRGRIIRQFLIEALILSFAGGALGILMSVFGIRWLVSLMPSWFPRVNEIGLDGRALLFTMAIVIVSAILVGIAPAIQGARGSTAESLKEGGRGGTGARGSRLRKMLVVGEISLALALLVSSALLVQAFINVRLADRGFDESDSPGSPVSVRRRSCRHRGTAAPTTPFRPMTS